MDPIPNDGNAPALVGEPLGHNDETPKSIPADAIKALPLYLDGSDGSLWPARSTWDDIASEGCNADRFFIRVEDVLKLLANLPTHK